jgi:hypothetical protein
MNARANRPSELLDEEEEILGDEDIIEVVAAPQRSGVYPAFSTRRPVTDTGGLWKPMTSVEWPPRRRAS